MPVTFRPASHPANPIGQTSATTADGLLQACCPDEHKRCDEILQSFLGRGPNAASSGLMHIGNGLAREMVTEYMLQNMRNGLVQAVAEAYCAHRALVLRPDDIWLAILTQFNFYVNAHAEELRSQFVAHSGKQTVVVYEQGTRYSVDFGRMAAQMTREMDKFIVDPALREWILPAFSTTTANDTVVAAVMMMATMKAYFDYEFCITCGIPQVTLAGTRDDWLELLRRAEKLKTFGDEPTAWYALLRPVLTRFVHAFDAPDSAENLDFWRRVVHLRSEGCGGPELYMSGWITAFCVWDAHGRWRGLEVAKLLGASRRSSSASTLYNAIVEEATKKPASKFIVYADETVAPKNEKSKNNLPKNDAPKNTSFISLFSRFFACGSRLPMVEEPPVIYEEVLSTATMQEAREVDQKALWGGGSLILDGIAYHATGRDGIPSTFANVDVLLNDNGTKFKAAMVAGIVGARVMDSGDKSLSLEGKSDTIAVSSGWWMYIKKA